jgi:hypothetical protein
MDHDELLKILAALKSSHRRMYIILVCFVLLVTLLGILDKLNTNAEVKSHGFVLMDASGKSVATLKPQDNGACLELSAVSKASVITICSADNLGSYVSMMTRNGETQAVLSTGESITEAVTNRLSPRLVLATQNGQRSFNVTLGKDLKLTLGDPSARQGITAIVPDAGKPTLDLRAY